MVRIMIVDDHALMRRIVREICEKEGDLEVVAEAANGLEAEQLAEQMQPDVVLMDLDMPDCNGLEGTERVLVRAPHSHIVIFTASRREQHLFQALEHGAVGYITKDVEPEVLVQSLRNAARNELCLPATFAAQVIAHLRTLHNEQYGSSSTETTLTSSVYRVDRRFMARRRRTLQREQAASPFTSTNVPTPSSSEEVRPLTEREQEILDLMRRGRKNREIAVELCIAESTVHKHVQNIFEKLHARNRTEAIYLTSAT